MDKLLRKYRDLALKLKMLENEKEDLKTAIMADMGDKKIGSLESAWGKFTIAMKVNWIYTKEIEDMAEELKVAKIKEEQSGRATPSAKEYLVYTPL